MVGIGSHIIKDLRSHNNCKWENQESWCNSIWVWRYGSKSLSHKVRRTTELVVPKCLGRKIWKSQLLQRERDRQAVNLYVIAATIVVMTVNTILPCWGPEWETPPMAKVMRKEAWRRQRRDQASGNPLFPSIYPKTRVCFMLSPTPLTLRGLSPITISLGEGVNM